MAKALSMGIGNVSDPPQTENLPTLEEGRASKQKTGC